MDLFVDNYGKSMLEAAKCISNWTYGVSLFPKNLPVFKTFKDVFRMGTVGDVFVERDDVEGSAKLLLQSVKDGDVKKLVAGTGTGKSTLVPVSLACSTSGRGIVITPTRQLAKSLESYVRNNVAIGRYSKCSTVMAYEFDDLRKSSTVSVVYFSASDFLMMLAQDHTLFSKVNISYVYVDEAHERIPQYAVLRYLLSAGFFDGTRVFMGSATSSDQNMESRTSGVSHKVSAVKPEHLAYSDPDSLTIKSPLYHSKIVNRTLVFLPGSDSFGALLEYYESNALPVMCLPEYASSQELYLVNEFLKERKRPAVVLLTATHQTGYTFEAETVVDCGVTQEMIIDAKKHTVAIIDRKAYEFERVQRCGRVGRHMPGVAYHVDADVDTPEFELYPGSECYVALWCRLFSLNLKNPLMRKWASFVESMSEYKICLLLCATIHPVILSVFIDDQGDVAQGTRIHFLNFLRRQRKLVSTSRVLVPELMTQTWQEQILVLPCISTDKFEYKSQYVLPEGWQLWAHCMYYLMQGENFSTNSKIEGSFVDAGSTIASAMSSTSGISVAMSDVSLHSRKSTKKRPNITGTSSKDKHGDGTNRRDSHSEDSVRKYSEYSIPFKSNKYDPSATRIPAGASERVLQSKRPPSYKSTKRTVEVPDIKVDDVDEYVKLGKTSKRSTEAVPVKSTRSEGTRSKERFDHSLPLKSEISNVNHSDGGDGSKHKFSTSKVSNGVVSLDVRTMKRSLIMPLDLDILPEFELMERNTDYYSIFRPLKHNQVKLSAMTEHDVIKHFIATLVTWNHAVTSLMQLESMPENNLVSRSLKTMRIHKESQALERIRPLLRLFEAYQMRITYKFKPQGGSTELLSELGREIEMAEYARVIGTAAYRATWNRRNRIATAVYNNDKRVGAAVKDGDTYASVCHVLEGDTTRPREYSEYNVAEYSRDFINDLVIMKVIRERSSASCNTYREPVIGENVTTFFPLVTKVVAVGFYSIVGLGDHNIYDAVLPDGASGCPLVAYTDGAIVGIHRGTYPCFDGQVMSSFVPFRSAVI